jgi:hypothetical protein
MWVASPMFIEVTLLSDPSQRRGRRVRRPRRMTRGTIASATRRLGDGMPPREVANHLGVALPMLYREVPAASRHTHSGGDPR